MSISSTMDWLLFLIIAKEFDNRHIDYKVKLLRRKFGHLIYNLIKERKCQFKTCHKQFYNRIEDNTFSYNFFEEN